MALKVLLLQLVF